MKDSARATTEPPKRTSYWLLVKNRGAGIEVLTTRLSDGWQTLPVFSFREEAEMFLCLGGSQEGWQVRETTPGELLSTLHTLLRGVRRVTLDPIPTNSSLNASRLLTVTRKDFMARLVRANGRRETAGKGTSSSPASNSHRRPQRSG
jgi:hypothetical protein